MRIEAKLGLTGWPWLQSAVECVRWSIRTCIPVHGHAANACSDFTVVGTMREPGRKFHAGRSETIELSIL